MCQLGARAFRRVPALPGALAPGHGAARRALVADARPRGAARRAAACGAQALPVARQLLPDTVYFFKTNSHGNST
jgi:hypothetical protein